jgi:hypothetical protein
MIINDLLIQDPSPSKANPNPIPPQTLFRNELGQIISPKFEPISRSKHVSNQICNSGLPQYEGTKCLLAYISYIMSLPNISPFLNCSIFSEQLIKFFKHPLSDLKKRLGNDNKFGFIDYLSKLIISLVCFDEDFQPEKLTPSSLSPSISIFISVLSNNIFCDSVLELINFKLLHSSNLKSRCSIISSLILIHSLPNILFSTSFSRKLISWSFESRIVGIPLPQSSIDFANQQSKSAKVHIDIKRTIISSIVSYFKCLAMAEKGPIQFDELFEILQTVFNSCRTIIAPTFCQLVRPKFCRYLSNLSPSYKELLPESSSPRSLLSPQFYGEISMPHKIEIWKEKYEKFITSFLGTNLLSKDAHLLQLTIQVLTKIGVHNGEISIQIAQFILKTFEAFNVLTPSSILTSFIFNFCFSSNNQEFTQTINEFVKIFGKCRFQLDNTNLSQIEHIWFEDDKYDEKIYQPLTETFSIFEASLSHILSNTFKEADLKSICSLSKRILIELEGEGSPIINFPPYLSFRNHIKITSNEELIKAISLDPSEEAMSHLIMFLKQSTLSDQFPIPPFVSQVFTKNQNFLNINLLNELSEWPEELAQNKVSQDLLRTPIKLSLQKIGKDSETCKELLPKLWKFSVFRRKPLPVAMHDFGASSVPSQAPVHNSFIQPARGESFMFCESKAIPLSSKRPYPSSHFGSSYEVGMKHSTRTKKKHSISKKRSSRKSCYSSEAELSQESPQMNYSNFFREQVASPQITSAAIGMQMKNSLFQDETLNYESNLEETDSLHETFDDGAEIQEAEEDQKENEKENDLGFNNDDW